MPELRLLSTPRVRGARILPMASRARNRCHPLAALAVVGLASGVQRHASLLALPLAQDVPAQDVPVYDQERAYQYHKENAQLILDLEHPVLNHFASLHAELTICMWGDSTMQRQFSLLRMLMGGPSFDVYTGPNFQIPISPLPKELMHGNGASAAWCTSADIYTYHAAFGNATFTLFGGFCTTGAVSVAMVPAVLDLLQQMPSNFTPPADSLMYIGGAGVHHLHIDGPLVNGFKRDWAAMQPLVEAFEENTKFGLLQLQESYPQSKLAYFNTHSLCNERIVSHEISLGQHIAHERAVACDSHDWEACFSGYDLPAEERKPFCESLFSHHGSNAMAIREHAVLKDPRLKWALVDGYKITKDLCDQTDDGVHFSPATMMKEIEDALTVLRKKKP